MKKYALLLLLLLIVLLPFALRDSKSVVEAQYDDQLVILSGHNENLRFEMGQGFQRWYKKKTGRTVYVDWRYLGGISELVRYLESSYYNAFRYHWTEEMGREWTGEVGAVFGQRTADESRWDSDLKRELYGEYYSSEVGCGMDIFFGGGEADFVRLADRGDLVDSGFLAEHSELFSDDVIPEIFGGGRFWDSHGRWFGQVLSSFGILYNVETLKANGLSEKEVVQWSNLADPKFFSLIALADPTKSSALLKAFEIIIQQQMAFRVKALQARASTRSPHRAEAQGIRQGWLDGLRLLQLISCNTRYFAETPTKMILDVANGNSALGISVCFMAKTQADFEKKCCGYERVKFLLPKHGCAPNPDSIGILRGAPNMVVAKMFLEYALGEEGQKMAAFRTGTPGGPLYHALYRPPINIKLYDSKYDEFKTSLDNPYDHEADFCFHPERTYTHYAAIRWLIKTAFIDAHDELVAAWKAICRAREEKNFDRANRAQAILQDFSGFEYDAINQTLQPVLEATSPASALAAQRQFLQRFRKQYLRARDIALGREKA